MSDDPLSRILAEIKDQRHPPVERWEPDFCGDLDMRIAADGRWFYLGTPIGRQRMVQLFASVLRKDADGKTYLVTPVEKIGITVDDAHFVVTDIDISPCASSGAGDKIIATTNVGDKILIGPDNPLWVETIEEAPRPYIRVRGRLDALINRNCFYRLVEAAEIRLVEDEESLWVSSNGADFCLGTITEAIAEEA